MIVVVFLIVKVRASVDVTVLRTGVGQQYVELEFPFFTSVALAGHAGHRWRDVSMRGVESRGCAEAGWVGTIVLRTVVVTVALYFLMVTGELSRRPQQHGAGAKLQPGQLRERLRAMKSA